MCITHVVCDLLCTEVLLQFSSSNYEVDEDNGTVTVCMTKDLETARAFTATATAREFESDFEGMVVLIFKYFTCIGTE